MTEIRFFIYLFFNEAIFRTIILTFFMTTIKFPHFFNLMSKVYYILLNLYDQQLSKVNLINITLIFTTKLTKNKA